MRLFSRKPKYTLFQLQGEVATASKAVYQGYKQFPTVLLSFDVKGTDPVTGKHFDKLEIELDLYTASHFANQLLVSIDAALPARPRGPQRTVFGE